MTRPLFGAAFFRAVVMLVIMTALFIAAALAAGRLLPSAGQIVYTTWIERYQIITLDIATGVRHILLKQSAEPCCLSYSPDGGQLAYLTSLNDGPPRIAVVGWNGSNPRPLVDDYVGGIRPIWSADSQWVAFRRPYTEPATVATRLQTGEVLNVALLTGQTLPPQWSPDGQYISFMLPDVIYIAPATCLEAAASCAIEDYVQIPAVGLTGFAVWSPDSSRLALALYQQDQLDIYTVQADGQNLRQLTNDKASDQLPAWSPDGRYLAFNSDREGQWAVYIMEADGTNLRRLSQTTVNAFLYAAPWSPDGQSILFATDRDPAGSNRTMAIYTVDLAGQQRQLVDGLFFAPSPVWWAGYVF
jgi:Tol biopolymer transport system component